MRSVQINKVSAIAAQMEAEWERKYFLVGKCPLSFAVV